MFAVPRGVLLRVVLDSAIIFGEVRHCSPRPVSPDSFKVGLEIETLNGNTALGFTAGINLSSGSNNIMIGNQGLAADDSTIRIGDVQTKTFIAGIRNATT